MAKPEWGKKLTCPSCGARFYDLNKSPATCPKCEATVEVQQLLKPKRQAPDAVKPKKAAPAPEAIDDEDDDSLLDDEDDDIDLEDDEDDDLIEDTSDLEEDEDDVSEVKEHIDIDADDAER